MNDTNKERSDFRSTPNGLEFWVYTPAGVGTFADMVIGRGTDAGNVTITNLAGTGSSYPVRSDANGVLNVNRSAGAGITMQSPNGNVWCVTISNTGAFASVAGACP